MTLPTPSPSLEPPPEYDSPLDTSLLTEEAKRGLVDALYSVRAPLGCLPFNEERLTLPTLLPLQIQGAKTLILERDLASPVGLTTEISTLKVRPLPLLRILLTLTRFGSVLQHQAVEKIHWLEHGSLVVDPAVRNIVWMCRPEIRWMKLIAGTYWNLSSICVQF